MTRTVFTQSIKEQRRGLLSWAAAVAAVVFVYVPSYTTYAGTDMLANTDGAIFDAMGITDMASPVGYLNSTMFAFLGPMLFILFAAVAGAKTAGQEESGTLDLLLAQPIGRVKLLVQRFAALAAATGFLTLVCFLAIVGATGSAGMSVGTGNLAATTANLGLLGLTFGSIALMTGALTGRKVHALGAAAGLGVATYFANTLGPQSESTEWLKYLSPFHYFNGDQPLVNGLHAGNLAVLVALPLLFLAIAVWRFDRRDLAV